MNLSIKMQISRSTLFRVLYLLPFFSINDVFALYEGTLHDKVQVATPLALKLVKDLLVAVTIVYFFRVRRRRFEYLISSMALYFLLALILLLSIISYGHWNNYLLLVAGVRWSLPVILLCVLIGAVKKNDLIFIANILRWIFIVHFAFQLMEWLFGGGYYGIGFWGLNARSPGIFVIPNTGGLFTVFCAYMYMFFLNQKRTPLMYFIFTFSAFLTGSGTAIVTILLLFFLDKIYLRRKLWLIFSPVVFLGIFAFVIFVLSDVRPDSYVELSLGTRFHILYHYMVSSGVFSNDFGATTNTAVQLGIPQAVVVDSLYASILGNLGWIGMFGFMIFIMIALYLAEMRKNKELFVFLNIFMVVGFTSIINEAFPMNYLTAILFAYLLNNVMDAGKIADQEVLMS